MNEVHHNDVVHRFIDVLDALGIPYAIGGSIASSAYGLMRFTQDADITVRPFASVAREFHDRIKNEFYISEQAMQQALTTFGCFNVIHFETSFKIDLFIQGPSEFEQQLLARRKKVQLTEGGRKERYVIAPEDIILLKLRWFRETDGTSERQWDDVMGVLAVRGETLDHEYLTRWAERFGLQELLNRALVEART